MIDPVTTPAQEPAETTKPDETAQFSKRLRALMAAVIVVAILAAVAAVIAVASSRDPYKEWPAAGTQPPFAGEQPFYANAIVAVTCRNGEAYMDQRMLVDVAPIPGGSPVTPDRLIAFHIEYDQGQADHCGIGWEPLPDTRLETVSLEYDSTQPASETGKHWVMLGSGWSLDGASSLMARKGSKDIAVLLINFKDYPRGPEVKLGSNGLLAPSKDLIKS